MCSLPFPRSSAMCDVLLGHRLHSDNETGYMCGCCTCVFHISDAVKYKQFSICPLQ